MPYSPSILAKAGRSMLLKVGGGTSPTSWTTIGGLRTTGVQMNNNPVDITNMGSGGYRELLGDAGVQSMSFTGDGVADTTTGADLLQAAARNRTAIECQLTSGHNDIFSGWFFVSTFSRSGTFDGVETFNVTLESSGRVNYSG